MIRFLYRVYNSGGLLRDSSILFAGTMGVHVLNVLFQMFMGRYLHAEEYALLAALLGIFNIISTPLSVVISTFNRYSSLLMKEGRPGDVLRLGLRWGIRLAVLGAVPSALCLAFPKVIAAFLHLDRSEPVYIFGLILIGVFCRPVVDGMLLGMQRFKLWCISNLTGAVMRLAIGIGLVLLVSPYAGWGLLGHGVGFYTTILVAGVFILLRSRGLQVSGEPLPRIEGFLFGSFFILLGCSVLMTADVVLVKNLYPAYSADFAYAATLARLILLVPASFVGAMFPKVVGHGQGTAEQLGVLQRTLVLSLLSTLGAAIAVSLLAGFLPRFIFGLSEVSADLVRWVRMLSFIMIPVALTNVLIRFLLAQHQLLKAGFAVLAAGVYIGSSYLLTTGVDGILYSLAASSMAAFLLSGGMIWMDARKIRRGTV